MATAVVRVDQGTHHKLKAISEAEHQPIGRVISRLVEQYETDLFWREVEDSVERLRRDPIAWKDYQDEIAFFDRASMDGLNEEEPYYTPEEEAAIYAQVDRA